MRLYRFGSNPNRSPQQEFSGRGGVVTTGRWHFQGTPCVYTALSESVALLEVLAHRHPEAGTVYPLYTVDVPDDLLERLPTRQYPPSWDAIPPSPGTQSLGAHWLWSKAAVGLVVRSVISKREHNCLVNPEYPGFLSHVTFHQLEMVTVDPRLSWPPPRPE